MSIDSYFKRNNKVIDDDPTPACSPHPSESSESTTVIPAMQATPLQRQAIKDKDNKDNSLLLVMNLPLLVGRRGGEGGAGEGEQHT